MLGTLLVTGCGGEQEGAADRAGRQAAAPASAGGRVIDLAAVLTPAEQTALVQRLAKSGDVTVVIVKTGPAQSLEQIGWAVGRPGSLLLLLDPESRKVRVEGELSPEAKAAVASAMSADLSAGRVAAGVSRGLDRLAQEERSG